EGTGSVRADRQSACPFRPRHPRRTRLPAVQRIRRGIALPSTEQTLRAHQRHYYHQSQLQQVGQRLRRRQDDDRATRPFDASLPYPRNRKRQLPLQEQFSPSTEKHDGEKQELDHNTRPETYIEAGQISVEIPGQFSVAINSMLLSLTLELYPQTVERITAGGSVHPCFFREPECDAANDDFGGPGLHEACGPDPLP